MRNAAVLSWTIPCVLCALATMLYFASQSEAPGIGRLLGRHSSRTAPSPAGIAPDGAIASPAGEPGIDELLSRATADPLAAMNLLANLTDPMERDAALQRLIALLLSEGLMSTSMLEVWAEIDPSGVFEFLESGSASVVRLSSLVLENLAADDYGRLLQLAESRAVPPPLARRVALQQWGRKDPNSALAYADALPQEQFDINYPLVVAMSYGQQGPEAALTWAKSLQPPRLEIVSAVLTGIAETDSALALEVLLAELASPIEAERATMRAHIADLLQTVAMNEDAAGLDKIFDRVIAAAGTTEGVELARPMIQWSETDPRAAFDWARHNAKYVEPIDFSLIARRLAEKDPTQAGQALYGLPEHLQAYWAGGVAIALAQQNDSGARDWLMSLAQGELRDAATRAFLSGQALNGSVDSELFAQIADRATYQRAVLDAAMRLACSDPASALHLVDQQLETDEERESVLVQVRVVASAPGVICGSFNVY